MDQIELVQRLVADKAWVALTALAVGGLVRLLKSDRQVAWFPWAVPARWRALLALGLGVAASTLSLRARGSSWLQALLAGGVEGLVAGGAAVATHDVVIEGLRDGRELGQPEPERGARGSRLVPPPDPGIR